MGSLCADAHFHETWVSVLPLACGALLSCQPALPSSALALSLSLSYFLQNGKFHLQTCRSEQCTHVTLSWEGASVGVCSVPGYVRMAVNT